MEDLTNAEKTVIAHLSLHHRITPWEGSVKKIFGGDEAERKRVLTSLRDRGFINHFKRTDIPTLQHISPSQKARVLGTQFVRNARNGTWTPDNIVLDDE